MNWKMHNNGQRTRRGLPFAALVAVLICFASAQFALAQVPKLGEVVGEAKRPQAEAPVATIDLQKIRAGIEGELRTLQERVARSDSPTAAPALPGVTAEEQESARRVATLLIHTYQSQLDLLAQIEIRRKAREAAELAEKNWSGFTQKPPYSILLADEVQEEMSTHRDALNLVQTSRHMIDAEAARFRERSEQSKEAVRRAADVLQRAAPGTDARAVAAWRLDRARDEAKLAEAPVAATTLLSRELDEKLGLTRAQLRLAERQRALLAGKVRITESDIEEARARLTVVRDQRQKQLQSLVIATARETKIRDEAQRALETLRAAQPGARAEEHSRRLRVAGARLRAAEARVGSLRQQVRFLSIFTTVYHQMIVDAWGHRYTVLAGGDADARLRARTQLQELVEFLAAWQKGVQVRQSEVRAALRAQEARVQGATDPETEKYEREAFEAGRELDLALDSFQQTVARRLLRLGHWHQEFDDATRAFSIKDSAQEILARLKVVAKKFWNFELLTIEDTAEIGGQRVTTTRGITVGKSLGAILLFLIGYRVMRFFSAAMERMLVRRFSVSPEQGKTLRRWADTLGVFLLLMITLNLARIPLTVFAFAGGALAIGIGFGTQTLIKNLISGVILLVERQVKVGDIVDVEGVVGTVSEVNIRSSTVRGFDGVETMVPNSLLLEQKVTNWTLSNRQVRRIVKVGVAYGSPVRQVAEVLADCAGRHGLVLKDPAPRVIFEDFGDNALVFALYFWVDIAPDTSTLQVMSDLRFMMEKQLAEAGIVVAFPQRDVHLDVSRPLKVEMVSPPASGEGGGGQVNRG